MRFYGRSEKGKWTDLPPMGGVTASSHAVCRRKMVTFAAQVDGVWWLEDEQDREHHDDRTVPRAHCFKQTKCRCRRRCYLQKRCGLLHKAMVVTAMGDFANFVKQELFDPCMCMSVQSMA